MLLHQSACSPVVQALTCAWRTGLRESVLVQAALGCSSSLLAPFWVHSSKVELERLGS